MKISFFYESNYRKDYTWLDVPEDEMSIVVENDYQERLAKADEGENVERRDFQTIMDEEISKPTYNSHHKNVRRHVLMSRIDPKGERLHSALDLEKMVCGGKFGDLREAIKTLEPAQRDLVRKVFWDGADQRQIAAEEGVDESAISKRMARIYARLEKALKKTQKDSE